MNRRPHDLVGHFIDEKCYYFDDLVDQTVSSQGVRGGKRSGVSLSKGCETDFYAVRSTPGHSNAASVLGILNWFFLQKIQKGGGKTGHSWGGCLMGL
ncbi:MAG: hypothetical protein SV775_00690 [Thermodesulfobacteriota bacterium]|nr:hypothetical protein [Thermodesulfobacteriota bacterium]